MSIDMKTLCEDSMLTYSSAVNEERAIPDSRTGLKPIHQKILYEMWVDKVLSNQRYRKCAYMVGQIISRFSQHGDAATYDALIRLSQQWVHPIPLIDVHGNNGSQFGDSAASMRYVESRLTEVAEKGFLASLGKNCIDWKMNFTNDEKEPETLPAVFPGLFCLQEQGLGYACACYFLTYNLREIADVLIKYIKIGEFDDSICFDLATGGTIVNKSEMAKIHKTGKGKIIVESKASFENNNIVITEVPLGVPIDDLIENIADVCEKNEYPNVKSVYNDSGNGQIRVVIQCKNQSVVQTTLDYLLQNTKLRNSYAVNQVALVDKVPTLLTTEDMCRIYKEHNLSCIKREHEYDLNKTVDRIEILEGLERAYNGLDNVIALIRHSKSANDAKTYMTNKLGLTERQADAILSLKLSRLAKLEKQEILDELQEKREKAEHLRAIVESEDEQKKILISRLKELADKFGGPRRTQLIDKKIEKKSAAKKKEEAPHSVIICLDENGYVKSVPLAKFRSIANNVREDKAETDQLLIFYSSLGRMFRVKVSVFKEGLNSEKGTALGSILSLEPQEKIVDFTTQRCKSDVIFVMSDGYIKRMRSSEVDGTTQNLRGMTAVKVHDGAHVVLVSCANGFSEVIVNDKQHFNIEDMEIQGKASPGRKLVKKGSILSAAMA